MSDNKYPTEDPVAHTPRDDEAEKDARVAAAREKAAAAKAAAERRRSTSSRSPSGSRRDSAVAQYRDGHQSDAEVTSHPRSGATTPIIVKRHPSGPTTPKTSALPLVPTARRHVDATYTAPAHEDPAANARELAAIKAELAALEEDDANFDERLQLYSEVISMRKELEVVYQDEQRLRDQRDNTEKIVAAHDPEISKEVAMLEHEAEESALANVWKEESAIHNPDKMDWATIDITNLADRVAASKATVQQASAAADQHYGEQEKRINENTDNRERTKNELRESLAEEMATLGESRALNRQKVDEVKFHRRRGTAKGREPVVPKQTLKMTRARRVDETENRTIKHVGETNAALDDLMEECKVLKKQLDDSKRVSAEKQKVLEVQLQAAEEEGSDARTLKEKLEKEKEELTAVKTDLQGVLHYVRAKNREEEDF